MILATVLAEAVEETKELPAEPWVFGLSGLIAFFVLLFIVTRFDPDR